MAEQGPRRCPRCSAEMVRVKGQARHFCNCVEWKLALALLDRARRMEK